ncbi:GGDEF domain-containing protein [archaeon]|jgi:diguanylate cyclase (GGDEF)-like protein|nr:GGDEF domain-containing protein [archaeon]MBT3731340.1 GGDEF domain-containing protein [archaeon]MBT4670357.1 GGDEF domain-containing protein [archaeon]MBT5030207.1 GGDEF domain-containing protein [archaeon]MBT5287626.1 GGDEF domain-containing protein [archaeon]
MTERTELEAYLNVFLEEPSMATFEAISEVLDPSVLPELLDFTYSFILEQRDPQYFDLLIELNNKKDEMRKAKFEDLRQLSTLDPLTGLPNRRGLYQRLDSLMSIASRKSSPLSISILDIDHFKRFNDTHGHLVGDEALTYFGNFFKERLRGSDLISRFGGEEFVVCLYGPSYASAIDKIKDLGRSIQTESLRWEYSASGVNPISFSAGLSWLSSPSSPGSNFTEKITELLNFADRNLYKAKESGRNALVSSKVGFRNSESLHHFA